MELSRLHSLYEAADSQLRSGQFAAASEQYSAVLASFGFRSKALLNRAYCYLRLNRIAESLQDVEAVLREPESLYKQRAKYLQTQCHIQSKDFQTGNTVSNGSTASKSSTDPDPAVLSQEYETVEKLRKYSLAATEWTILPMSWHRSWHDYTKQQSPISPGVIDSSPLLQSLDPQTYYIDPHLRFKHMNVIVRDDAQEGLDFLLVPMPVFELLSGTYGFRGEVLRRNAVNGDVELRYRRVPADCFGLGKSSLSPKFLQLSRIDKAQEVRERLTRCLQHSFPMSGVVETAANLWRVPKNDQRLLREQYGRPVALADAELVKDDVVLAEEDMLVIEFQKKDGSWLLTKAPKDLCINCHKPNAQNLCGGCRQVRYCSRECQQAHFHLHKQLCKKHKDTPEKPLAPREGLCGLGNLGNTCFMNAALQCASHIMPLTRYFLQDTYLQEINKNNVLGSGGNLARAYASLLKNLWEGSASRLVPYDFRRVLAKFAPRFSELLQQDSHELLNYLLDGLHEDLNRVIHKQQTDAVEGNGTDDERVSAESWENHLKRNRSIVVDLTHGQCKSTLTCPQCDRVSITFDPFMTYTLQLSQFEVRTVSVYYVPLKTGLPRLLCFRLKGTCTIETLKSLIQPHVPTPHFELWSIVGRKLQRSLLSSQTVEDTLGQTIMAFETDSDFDVAIPVVQTLGYDKVISWSRVVFAKSTDAVASLRAKVAKALDFAVTRMQRIEGKELYGLLATKGKGCGLCSVKTCRGCRIPEDGELTIGELRSRTGKFGLEVQWSRDCKDLRFLDYCEGSETAKFVESAVSPSLSDVVRLSNSPETLDADNMWYCSRCEDHVQATKQYEFYRTPQVLIFHLKRFKPRLLEKLNLKVDFQVTGLQVKTLAKEEPEVYDLFAVVNHMGQVFGGHYTAFVKNERGGGWFEMNDDVVSPMKEKDIVTPHAYLLFYSKRYQED